jgi:polyphosphate kinase
MLIRAAEAGKQVVCLVELKARFDEQENIMIAQALEKAGVHVVYGPLHIKVHTKIALIVRREEDGVRCYAHIGTGNYHVVTARVYDDVGILTDDHDLTRDVAEVFNSLTGRGLKYEYRKLLLAPLTMKRRFLKMIRREVDYHKAGKPARIVAKLNQVEDRDVCRALYRASQAGVPIDLIVRGFCILRPGLPGLSENIRVTSVIGRFLEHSRIYYFRSGAKQEVDGEFYFGSADWMPRNLERRVEVITPIEARPFREKLWERLQVYLRDRRNAWDMTTDGAYVLRTPPESGNGPEVLGSQRTFIELVREEHGAFGVELKRVRRGD